MLPTPFKILTQTALAMIARIDMTGYVSTKAVPIRNAIRIRCTSTTSLLVKFSSASREKNTFFEFHHFPTASDADKALFLWIDNVFILFVYKLFILEFFV